MKEKRKMVKVLGRKLSISTGRYCLVILYNF